MSQTRASTIRQATARASLNSSRVHCDPTLAATGLGRTGFEGCVRPDGVLGLGAMRANFSPPASCNCTSQSRCKNCELNQGVIDGSATHDYPPPIARVIRKRAISVRADKSDSSTCQPHAYSLDGPAAAAAESRDGRAPCGLDAWPVRDLAPESLRRVREYVDAHLGSRLDVNALARIVGLSASQFSRTFHKAVGVPPHRYVVQCRVIRARELLATTRSSLTEIALTIGFADHSHFSRRFHEFTGVPPREFRRLAGGTPR
jgi:AraC-like DNA-binding protein